MPFSEALATNLCTMSAVTGFEPTRNRPRRAIPSGVCRARVDGADSLPRALDGALDRRVEHASAGHLEVGETGLVEDLRDPQDFTGRHLARERLLREQPYRRIDDLWHQPGTLPRFQAREAPDDPAECAVHGLGQTCPSAPAVPGPPLTTTHFQSNLATGACL